MSEENVELTRRIIRAFQAGGLDAATLSHWAPDVVWYPIPEWIETPAYRGHEGVREFMAVWFDNFDEYRIGGDDFRDAGEAVGFLGVQSARMTGTAVPIRQPFGMVFSDFRDDGTSGEARFFLSWKEALEAAGLPE